MEKERQPPPDVTRLVMTVVDKVVESIGKSGKGSMTLEEIQEKHMREITREHIERWAGGLQAHGIAALEPGTTPLESPKLTAKQLPSVEPSTAKKKLILEVMDSYELSLKSIPAYVEIVKARGEYTLLYLLHRPEIASATAAVLDSIKVELARLPGMKVEELTDVRKYAEIEARFTEGAREMISLAFPGINKADRDLLADILIVNMLGLGDIDLVMSDKWVEDIAINNAHTPVWLYHRKYGWLKTNLIIGDERKTREMAEAIGRRVGRQISMLSPLLDAHLVTGDRVNATLFSVSPMGNTLTIRRFARVPWTIVHMIENGNMSIEMAAFIWLAVQHEINTLIIGGTASGKTSMLNAILSFVQPNHRIISIEDTREICLADFVQWIPLVSRLPNPEGKGEITMLQLMVNSLRMRPDRMVVGEIRTRDHAVVMFEAIHTGHSVYGTFHSDNAGAAFRRLLEEPIAIPPSELQGMQLFITQFRDRRLNRRRTSQIVEIAPSVSEMGVELNPVYHWDARLDTFVKVNPSVRVFNDVSMSTGMTEKEIEKDIERKMKVLSWLQKNKIDDINNVSSVVANYYEDEERLLELIEKGATVTQIIKW
ncbi:MAG: type II/IV secretion system ATPase subunit [Candidatus Micrarchaeia archaeon]